MLFLAHLFHKEGQKHGATAAARSPLSAILSKIGGKLFDQDPSVSQMIKVILKLRLSLPKYVITYDPDIILRYIDSLPHDKFLLLELLTKKLGILLCLLSWQRVQSSQALKLSKSNLSNGTYTFYIDKVLKTTKPGKHQKPLEYREFSSNKKFCVVPCPKEYISRTELITENLEGNQLILSYAYPHKPINCQSIVRYIKLYLELSGIDVTVFTAHSTRRSSTNKASNVELCLKGIEKAAGWRGSSTFRKYYNLPLIKDFGEEILVDLICWEKTPHSINLVIQLH